MLNYRCIGDFCSALAVKLRLSNRLPSTYAIRCLALLVALGLPASGITDYIPAEDVHANTTSIGWQMLPGESLNDLAALFYPHQRAMQQRFVSAALRLNRSIVSSGATKFDDATDVLIPDLKSLSYPVAKHVSAPRSSKKSPARINNNVTSQPINGPAPAEPPAVPVSTPADGPSESGGEPKLDMQAQYDRLVRLNLGFKLQLEQLNERITRLQALAEALFSRLQSVMLAELARPKPVPVPSSPSSVASPAAVERTVKYAPQSTSTPTDDQATALAPQMKEPSQFKELGSGKASIEEPPRPIDERVSAEQSISVRDAWIKWVAPFILTLVVIGGVVLIVRWRMHPMSHMTMLEDANMQPVFTITGQRRKPKQPPPEMENFGVTVQPEQTPLKSGQAHAHVEDVEQFVQAVRAQTTPELLGSARELVSAGQPVSALLMLQNYLGAYPRQSVLPWLHALEIHHSLDHSKAFNLLAEQMHQTFTEDGNTWSDTESGIRVESRAAHKSDIERELADIWDDDKTVYSTQVLKEIVVLQEVLKTRGQYSQGGGMDQRW